MSLFREPLPPIPQETAKVVRAITRRKKNLYVTFADEIGPVYVADDFADAYSKRGQPGLSPVLLLLVTLIQFIENLSDRAVVEALQFRIDLKYFLHLPLDYDGFDPSVLTEFRQRLIKLDATKVLLDKLLDVAIEKGLLKSSKQRTDSTHVLASVRDLNRLELVFETMRLALEFLIDWNFEWLESIAQPEWAHRYAQPCFNFRIPKKEKDKANWIANIGRDGYFLLEEIDKLENLALIDHPRISTLRKIWEQQFVVENDHPKKGPRLRKDDEYTIASSEMIVSPHDSDARLGTKRGFQHKGYKTHITETCDENAPHLISHVETTSATTTDVEMRPLIEKRLGEKGLSPLEHIVDAGYTDVKTMKEASDNGLDVIGPMQMCTSWQDKAGKGFALADFQIDWDTRQAICPAGKTTNNWSERSKESSLHIKFEVKHCSACPFRTNCTKGTGPRTLQVKERDLFDALARFRKRQDTEEFKKKYSIRAGVEGTISQAVRRSGGRRSRYLGLAKTHLQIAATAAALNILRLANWLIELPLAKTRKSPLSLLSVPA